MKNLSGFTALLKKELIIYFGGPIFYITGFFFLVLAGYFFYTNVLYYSLISLQAAQQASNPQVAAQMNPQMLVYRPLYQVLAIILIFLVPLLTMRLLAEEKRSGTWELLFTYPLTDWSIILGKFGAVLVIYLIFLAFTISFSVAFSFMTPVDWGALGAGYLGMVLWGLPAWPWASSPPASPKTRSSPGWWASPCSCCCGSSALSRSWRAGPWARPCNFCHCWSTTKISPKV